MHFSHVTRKNRSHVQNKVKIHESLYEKAFSCNDTYRPTLVYSSSFKHYIIDILQINAVMNRLKNIY